MAWDFSTEPEFEEKLEWMRTFVLEEIEPLETIELDYDTLLRLTAPLKEQVKAAMMVGMLRKMREHVEKNFENVGERFPEEARRIHYGEADEREIYGKATPEEAKELAEEGVPVRPLPDLPELDG